MEILTPEGVTVTTVSDRSIYDKTKNIVIAGSPSKGYKAFFTAKEDTHGEELWVSDGTVDGTKMVKDIYPGSVSSNVQYITRFNDKVVFQAVGDDESGNELWISDGTEEGTFMVKDINEIGDSNPRGFVQLDETRFVFATPCGIRACLWRRGAAVALDQRRHHRRHEVAEGLPCQISGHGLLE